MNSSKTLRIYVLALVMTLTGIGAGQAAAECVNYGGIDHCSIGAADLTLSGNGSRLFVTNLGANGNSGVTSHFSNATRWEGDLRVPNADQGDELSLTAISEGQTTSRSRLTLTAGGLEITSMFTGAVGQGSYSVIADDNWNDPLTTNQTIGPIDITRLPIPFPIPWPEPWPPIIVFGIRAVDGGCFWRYEFDELVTVSINGSQSQATSITLVENVDPGSHYSYDRFTAMGIQSNAGVIVVDNPPKISNGL